MNYVRANVVLEEALRQIIRETYRDTAQDADIAMSLMRVRDIAGSTLITYRDEEKQRDGWMMRHLKRLRLFFRVVGRQIEPPSCGIPDPYRIRGRFGIGLAWKVATKWSKKC